MKIVVLHGQNHKGSTYHIAKMFIDELIKADTQVDEFDFVGNTACVGCFQCFVKGEDKCPHYVENHFIIKAIEDADLVILESACYCMGITGQLKIFLDHMGYRWLSHRPHKSMYNKVGLTISTAAGVGATKVTKDLARNMFYWGISNINRYGIAVNALAWNEVSASKKEKIEKKIKSISSKIERQLLRPRLSIKSRAMFYIMRMNQKNNKWNPTDKNHWEEQGWLGKNRPWKE